MKIQLTGTDAIQIRESGSVFNEYEIIDAAPDDVKQLAHRDGMQFIPVRPGNVWNTQFAGAIIDDVSVKNSVIKSDGKLQCIFCSDGGVRGATIENNILQTNGRHFISLSMLSGEIRNNRDTHGNLVPIRLFPMRIGGNSDGTLNVYILSFKDNQYEYSPVEEIVKDTSLSHVTDHRFGQGRRANSIYLHDFDLNAFVEETEKQQLSADEMRSLALNYGSQDVSHLKNTIAVKQKEKNMKMSQHGVQILIKSEGFCNDVYLDSAGLPTIGIGHCLTQSEVKSGKIRLNNGGILDLRHGPISNDQVMALLENDLVPREAAVNQLFTVPLAQHQFDALVHWLFNVGEPAAAGSTLRRKLNQGDFDSVPAELRRWNKETVAGQKQVNQGLINRRETEVALWNGDYMAERGPIELPEVINNGMSPAPGYVPPHSDTSFEEIFKRYDSRLEQFKSEVQSSVNDSFDQMLQRQQAQMNSPLNTGVGSPAYDLAYQDVIEQHSKPSFKSKILGFAVSTGLAFLATKYGLNLTPEVSSTLETAIVGGGLGAIGVARLWFTDKILK